MFTVEQQYNMTMFTAMDNKGITVKLSYKENYRISGKQRNKVKYEFLEGN